MPVRTGMREGRRGGEREDGGEEVTALHAVSC
jgi:hypothetical protein